MGDSPVAIFIFLYREDLDTANASANWTTSKSPSDIFDFITEITLSKNSLSIEEGSKESILTSTLDRNSSCLFFLCIIKLLIRASNIFNSNGLDIYPSAPAL